MSVRSITARGRIVYTFAVLIATACTVEPVGESQQATTVTQPTRFADRALFVAGWDAELTTIDFATRDGDLPITDPEGDVYFPELTLSGVTFHDVQSYYNESIYWYPDSPVRIDLPVDTYAVGVDLAPFYLVAGTYTITLSTGEIFTQDFTPDDPWDTKQFFGYISDRAIEWMEVSYDNTYVILDDFVFGTRQTRFEDRASFAAAWGADLTTIDFSTRDDGSPITVPSSDAYFPELTLRGVTFQDVESYYNLWIYWFPSSPIRIDLPAATYAMGVDLHPFYSVAGTFTITLSTGRVFTVDFTPGDTWQFFGFVSDSAVEWMDVSYDNTYVILDNFAFGRRNRAPVLAPIASSSVDEGGTVSFAAVASDADGDALTFSLAGAPAGAVLDPSTGVFSWTATDGPASASFTVLVSDGELTDEEPVTISVDNVAPTVDAGADAIVRPAAPWTLAASFTDPGQDTWTCTIDWADGAVDTVPGCTPAAGITGTHAFRPGTYNVKVTATDDDGGAHLDEVIVTVRGGPGSLPVTPGTPPVTPPGRP